MTDALRAAMVRFTTVDPSLWPRAFAALRALGFNAIDLPLVWREHETADGRFDFTVGRCSLRAVLEAVAAAGMRAVVRVGPRCAPDARGLGLPDRVLFDRKCQARTQRQNPVMVPDLTRLVPLPSLVSRDFLREATTWVRAACEALAPAVASGAVARVIVGHGPYAALHDDPSVIDHHPDGRGEGVMSDAPPPMHDDPVTEVLRERQRIHAYSLALAQAAMEAGVSRACMTLAVEGGALASPSACELSQSHRLNLAAPLPLAGTTAIWRQVGHGCALRSGVHWDLRAGSPVMGLPIRNTHAVQAARAAMAAGVEDYTVVMGCAGDRWVGALLDERAVPRAEARHWSALHDEAKTFPRGSERCVTIEVTLEDLTHARAEAATRPLPQGLLAWLGAPPGSLSDVQSPTGIAATRREAIERALTEAGVPWRWASDDDGLTATLTATDSDESVADAVTQRGAFAVPSSPLGKVLVRAVSADVGDAVMVLSAWHEPVILRPSAGWTGDGATLAPGEVAVLTRTGGSS